ncbi:XRE family transcriptional regulator [Romboutsia sp.]|uniref:XRE family transcriptional regulator n=1 Tax=Romboutsia sp. TaxID=1965302 RepID=UPI003F2BE419
MTLKEDNEISERLLQSDIVHLNMVMHIKKSLRQELSKTLSVILKEGWKQKYLAKILDLDQPKISQIKNQSPKSSFSEMMMMKFLKILGVNTIIDVGQKHISDIIHFYPSEDHSLEKLKKSMIQSEKE